MNRIFSICRQMCILAFACACFFSSCVSYETITDEFYLTNETEGEVFLVLNRSVVWDTCATTDLQCVWFNASTLPLKAGETVRLHPVRRQYATPYSNHGWSVISIVGVNVQLVIGNDTITWQADDMGNGHAMFTADTPWSIYNTESWDSSKDKELPNTYYHTFVITIENIERSKP